MAETNSLIQPGYIKLDEITISSLTMSKPIDISLLIREMNVYESLSQPFMTANFVVEDASSLFTLLPLTGEEFLTLRFSLPDPSFEYKKFKKQFRIVAIQDVTPTIQVRGVVYNLRCVAAEKFYDWTTRIRKSYSNVLISDIVTQITQRYLKINASNTSILTNATDTLKQSLSLITETGRSDVDKISISPTDGKRTICIPNMHPTEAIWFLSREAKSVKPYDPSNFVFFQNADGYFFKTIEEIIDKPTNSIDKYYCTEKNFSKTGDFIASNEIGNSGLPNLTIDVIQGAFHPKPIEFLKVNNYNFLKIFDLEDNLRRGAYDSTLYWIDPITSRYGKKTYNYKTDYNKFKRIDKNGGKFVKDNGDLSKLTGDSHWRYIISDSDSNKQTPENKVEFLHYLAASVAMLDYVSIEITVPGDCTRRVGDVIEISIPEYSAFDNTIDKENNHLSGRYLVVSLRHFYNSASKNGYSLVMQCVKNSYTKMPGTVIDNTVSITTKAVNDIVKEVIPENIGDD